MNYQDAILLLGGVSQIISTITKARERARQNQEWTPEQEAEFDTKLEAARRGELAHWKTEPDPS